MTGYLQVLIDVSKVRTAKSILSAEFVSFIVTFFFQENTQRVTLCVRNSFFFYPFFLQQHTYKKITMERLQRLFGSATAGLGQVCTLHSITQRKKKLNFIL